MFLRLTQCHGNMCGQGLYETYLDNWDITNKKQIVAGESNHAQFSYLLLINVQEVWLFFLFSPHHFGSVLLQSLMHFKVNVSEDKKLWKGIRKQTLWKEHNKF